MGFKLPGKSIQTGTSGHSSALKMVSEQRSASALKAKTDYVSMQARSAKKDPRYGKMSAADYETEVKRQVASKKSGKGYDAMGVYDKDGNKKNTPKATKETEKVEIVKAAPEKKDDALTANIKDKTELAADNTTTKGPKEGPREGTKKEVKKAKVAVVKDNLKDTKKQNKINTLEGKKDVADAKGKTKRSERLANRIERKKSRQDGDKSTNISRRDQRKAKTKNEQETINRENQDKYKESQKNTSSGNLKGSLANNEVKSTTKIKGSLS